MKKIHSILIIKLQCLLHYYTNVHLESGLSHPDSHLLEY